MELEAFNNASKISPFVLPADISFRILWFLPTTDILINVATSCRYYKYCCFDPRTWNDVQLVQLQFSDEYFEKILNSFSHCVGITMKSLHKLTTNSCFRLAENRFHILESLSLCNCQWLESKSLCSFLLSHTYLKHLDLSNSRGIDSKVISIVFSSKLVSLNLSQIGFDVDELDELVGGIRNLELVNFKNAANNLKKLSLTFCMSLTDTLLHWMLIRCPLLESLDLLSCIRVTYNSINSLVSLCPSINKLNLSRCSVSIEALNTLSILDLTELHMPHTWASNSALQKVTLFPKLRLLSLPIGARSLAEFDLETLRYTLKSCPLLYIKLSICTIVHKLDLSDLFLDFGKRIVNEHNCEDHGGFVGSGVKKSNNKSIH